MLVLVALSGAWLIAARRKHAALSFLVICALVASQQRIVIGGFDFSVIRIVILAGLARMAIRGDARIQHLNQLDYAIVSWIAAGTLMQTLNYGSLSVLIYRMGVAMDCFGVYFVVRSLLRTPADVMLVCKQLVAVSIPVALGMSIEWITHYNVFDHLGAQPFASYFRDGRIRCHGAFNHAILAGSFGAGVFPIALAVGIAERRSRLLAVGGVLASWTIVLASGSSGAVASLGAGLLAWGMWLVRRYLRPILLGIFLVLLGIHVFWKHPVWFLIGNATDWLGGEGWHRVRVIDAAARNFGDWWLMGASGREVADWGWGVQDITNAYVVQATRGGLLTLLTFLWVLTAGFIASGRRLAFAQAARRTLSDRHARRAAHRDTLLAWGLGAALFTHAVSFVGVLYFGHQLIVFYVQLALLGVLMPVRRPKRAAQAQRVPPTLRTARSTSAPAPIDQTTSQ